ncbi:MAG: lasso peptide biosynthesis PqqD family chaperone [Agarilytica sp.]
MAEKLTLSSIVRRNENIVDAVIDGETVMMSIENGQYYGLDNIASHIWQLVEKPMTIDDICQSLLEEYNVNPEQCESDVIAFLGDLTKSDVVLLSN